MHDLGGGPCPDDGCLDIQAGEETQDGGEGTTEGDCEAPEHVPCDDDANDLITAMGLNCPGEPQVNAILGGSPDGQGTHVSYGPTDAFNPTEGMRYAVLGSGFINAIDDVAGDCSQDLGAFDPMTNLPAPIVPMDVTSTRVTSSGNATAEEAPKTTARSKKAADRCLKYSIFLVNISSNSQKERHTRGTFCPLPLSAPGSHLDSEKMKKVCFPLSCVSAHLSCRRVEQTCSRSPVGGGVG